MTNEERDRLIAKKVFDAKLKEYQETLGYQHGDGAWFACYHNEQGMMAILEKMRELEYYFILERPYQAPNICSFKKVMGLGNHVVWTSEHEHLPTAVAIAALKALEDTNGN